MFVRNNNLDKPNLFSLRHCYELDLSENILDDTVIFLPNCQSINVSNTTVPPTNLKYFRNCQILGVDDSQAATCHFYDKNKKYIGYCNPILALNNILADLQEVHIFKSELFANSQNYIAPARHRADKIKYTMLSRIGRKELNQLKKKGIKIVLY